jgi:acyl dehydratase
MAEPTSALARLQASLGRPPRRKTAECTRDSQWIHVDVERARRESPVRWDDRARILGLLSPALVADMLAMIMV